MGGEEWIAVDIDGTICRYVTPWDGFKHFGEIMPGAIEGLHFLRGLGYKIVIFTCRTSFEDYNMFTGDLVFYVRNFLDDNEVPYDKIAISKPLAEFYIDDRGVRFDNWPNVCKFISRSKHGKLGISRQD